MNFSLHPPISKQDPCSFIAVISQALAGMRILAFILVCYWMEMGESSKDHIGTESTLIDNVLKYLPVKKCDSLIVSRVPLQNASKSTMFFNDVDDLISHMEDEEFVLTLSSMSCLILGSNSNMRSPQGYTEKKMFH